MKIIVAADEHQKNELNTILGDADVTWVENISRLLQYHDADAYIDLTYKGEAGQLQILKSLLPKTVVINSVLQTGSESAASFVRINGWPTFLKGKIIEAATVQADKQIAEDVFKSFNKQLEWTPDIAGFITPRVVSMIINEAYYAFAEQVSSKDDIDLAMKLGTNYPYGPFEWAQKIGLKNIAALLAKLSKDQSRYAPSELLLQEANC